MKKGIAVILAFTLLFSCISAFASAPVPGEPEESAETVSAAVPEAPGAEEDGGTSAAVPETGSVLPVQTAELSVGDAEKMLAEVETSADTAIPPVGTVYYQDDFSGSALNSRIVPNTTAGGTVGVKDGMLVIDKEASKSGWTGVDIYLNEDQSGVTMNEFVTQFEIRREAGSLPRVNIRMRGSGGEYTGINWGTSSGNTNLYYSNEKGKDNNNTNVFSKNGEYAKADRMTVTVCYNLTEQTFTMWLDENMVVQNKYPRAAAANDVRYLRIYMENPAGTVSVDNFKFYDLKAYTDDERVGKDCEALTYEELFAGAEVLEGLVAYDLTLPSAGPFGSTITWESSSPEVISNEGKVTRPDGEDSPEVTLTASIRSGREIRTKEFKVRVLTASIDLSGKPSVERMIYENDFSSGGLDDHIAAAADGGDIFVRDGTLHIARVKNEGTTIADIYPNADKTAVSGYIGVSYTLKKDQKKIIQQRMRMGGSSDLLAITWGSNNKVSCMAADTYGGAVKTYSLPEIYNDELQVTAVFNTMRGTLNLWLNGKRVLEDKYARAAPGNQLTYLRIYMEGTNLVTAEVDDLKIYNAVMSPLDKVSLDAEWLTAEQLLTKPYVKDNIIDTDLNLVTEGKYKSRITWSSSDARYITNDGKVTRPVDTDELPEVILTANIACGGFTASKSFAFKVQNTYSTDEKLLEAELKNVTEQSLMSPGDTDPNGVKSSLNLPAKGVYGAEISWKSSNRNVITNSGRVIRPRNDSQAETVTLTGTLRFGKGTAEKKLTFTVLPDNPWTDPNHMSDADFFGKWENSAWTVDGKLDYTRTELAGVEQAAKDGDYQKAKEEMLRHMRIRSVQSPVTLGRRENGWANMAIADIQNLQGNKYYQGDAKVSSCEYQPVYIPVKTGQIAKGGSTSYAVIAKYNEASAVLIAGLHHPNPEFRPKMEITVNGKTMIQDAADAAMIRAGSYKSANYAGAEDLTVKMFGDFLGDETYKTMLTFDFSSLGDRDTVTGVRLILHAKLQQSFAEPKELIALFEPSTFEERKATWNSFTGYVYNFNGLPEGTTWGSIPGADVEYGYQMPRFLALRCIAAEYNATRDEKYAYYMIGSMLDFIKKKGGRTTSGQGWPKNDPEIMAGFPRTLDTAERMRNWGAAIGYLVKSQYMTPEACTAILKTMWHMTNSMTKSTSSSGNWMQNEQMAIIQTALTFPEFAKMPEWIDGARKLTEKMFIETNNYPDGSYIEKTAGYSQSSLSSYIDFKRLMMSRGMSVSKEYDEMLLKSAYYNLQLYGPSGRNLQWGDDSAGQRKAEMYPELAKWYSDKELQYIDSFGKKGEKPDWTSMQFPDGRNTFMRSDWTKNALYLFTNVRGTGGHAHQDDNGLIVIAYDRILLPDSGIFTYTATDPDRIYGVSTRAHNTVEVNNKSGKATGRGTIHDWVTNGNYDFLSQSSTSYADVGHRRSILFIKPDLWIVSDLMTPKNASGKNSYKQLWHMLPDANLSTDSENGLIASNFKTGANILIGSAAKDAEVREEMGRYDFGYQQVTDAKYGYYEKTGVTGPAVFDTVLLPDRSNKNELKVERIDLGAAASEATAVKFDTTIDGERNRFYYLLDYSHKPGRIRTFDQYRTDGKLALVRESQNGKVQEAVLNTGSKIQTADGGLLLEAPKSVSDLSFRQIGGRLYIETTGTAFELKGLKVKLDNVKTVYVNDQAVAFSQTDGGATVLSDTPADVVPPVDSSGGHGGIGGSGGGGGGPVTPPEQTDKPGEIEPDVLIDIQGHWAEDYITTLYDCGIVKGDEEKRFHPDTPVTRAEFLTMMLRTVGIEETAYQDCFGDVSAQDWYSGAVQAGLDSGIISADTAFRPGDQITREEMCKILVLSAGEHLEQSTALETYGFRFSDAEQISAWAVGYVKIAAYSGLIEGKENGNFEPLSSATRAESAAVAARLLENWN